MAAERATVAPGALVWVERKPRPDGTRVVELIYELDAEPDVLRQVEIEEGAVYADARRGDRVLVVNGGESFVPEQ